MRFCLYYTFYDFLYSFLLPTHPFSKKLDINPVNVTMYSIERVREGLKGKISLSTTVLVAKMKMKVKSPFTLFLRQVVVVGAEQPFYHFIDLHFEPFLREKKNIVVCNKLRLLQSVRLHRRKGLRLGQPFS